MLLFFVRSPWLKVQLCQGVQEAFIPMQHQYCSHTSVLMDKLLCQHRLLTGKVTVSSGGGLGAVREGGGTDDGSRAAWEDRGRDVITVRSPQTSDTAAVHLNQLTLLFHFYWHKSSCGGNGTIIYPLSLWWPLTIHLSVSACLKQILLWGV